MKTHSLLSLVLAVSIGVIAILNDTPALGQQSSINVTFTNRCGYKVAYRLNGGGGTSDTIAGGRSKSWTVAVDPGVEPVVIIIQNKGKPLSFTLQDGGRYVFRENKAGKIVNFHE